MPTSIIQDSCQNLLGKEYHVHTFSHQYVEISFVECMLIVKAARILFLD